MVFGIHGAFLLEMHGDVDLKPDLGGENGMTLKYKIIDELKLVFVVGEGALAFEELVDHLAELAENPAYTPPMLKLVDYRKLGEIALTSAQSEKLADIKRSYGKRFYKERCAFVVSSDVAFGIGRQHQAYIYDNEMEAQIFKDFEQATEWLGIELDEDQLTVS